MNVIKNRDEWNSLVEKEFTEYRDVYFNYEYSEIYKKYYHVEPEGIFWEDDNLKIFWTHLVRNISKLDCLKEFNYFDLTTAYGYGGPLVKAKTSEKEILAASLRHFSEDYERYALKNDYVTEFTRFHPLFKNWEIVGEIIGLEHLNDVVAVDLTGNIDDLWKNIKKGQRYNIKKSSMEGCAAEILSEPSDSDIEAFLEFYNETMRKNRASKKYFFPFEFVKDHFNLLDSILVKIKYKNDAVGASMFILGEKIIHYHLSGFTADFKGIYPSSLALWEAIKWAKDKGFNYMHLGGGRGKNDSLFDFKKSFSNLILPFYIGKKIFDQTVYEKLLSYSQVASRPGDYFPGYRYGLQEQII
ncbi:MAG: GNAT family N-acetyltransferase [Candidatus Odinarchaeota archaeon]